MATKKSTSKTTTKSGKMSRDVRRMRTINIIFLVISALLILSMILAAVAKF
jgi:predicted nucleic acid-binding Zn ribbon protein